MKLQSFEETVKEYNKNQLINLKNNLYISQIVFRKLNLLFKFKRKVIFVLNN